MQNEMEIVIKLPRNWENMLATMSDSEINNFMYNVVRNGKVLPQYHGNLVDVESLLIDRKDFDTYEDYSRAFDIIDFAEIVLDADVKPIDVVKQEEFGTVYTSKEFLIRVVDEDFIPDDGIGYFHNGTRITKLSVWSNSVTKETYKKFPYVVWYNR